ncbi:MAG: hypothetical protein ACFB0G_10740 [Leptolyngbyaceae cyanobacterium]
MKETVSQIEFWWRWLVLVSLGVLIFGLILVLLPDFTLKGFSLMIYSSAARISEFGEPAVSYIRLVHAVLGAVMVGWGAALLLVLFGTFRENPSIGWETVTGSVLAWFIPDTTFSLLSGFWQNATLNAVFIVLFAIPLIVIKRSLNSV